jgi:predicted HicB family RNase H-like nuclease
MERNKTKRDSVPTQFKTIDELAKFWDTHDTENYPENWREASVTVRMKIRKYPRIVLDPLVAKKLNRRARAEGVSLNRLVNDLLKETLKQATR